MPVAAELTQQRLRVPQHEVRVAPATADARDRRTAAGPRGIRRPRTPGAGDLGGLAISAESTASGTRRRIMRSAAPRTAPPGSPPASPCPTRRPCCAHEAVIEVEERGDHHRGRNRAHRGRPGREVARHPIVDPERRRTPRAPRGRNRSRRGTARAFAKSCGPISDPCADPARRSRHRTDSQCHTRGGR